MTDTQTTPKNAEAKSKEQSATVMPRVDIRENDHEVMLQVDMPGVAPSEVDVRFEDGELHIRGKVGAPQEGETLAREFVAGDFYRSFRLHEALSTTEIEAEFKNGVLTVHLPKPAKNQPRQVTVKAS
jgi:HSP20 family protein